MPTGTPKATEKDYIDLQGGVPIIRKVPDSPLWEITHVYRPDSPRFEIHVDPKERGTIIIDGKEFEIAKLWKFEGQPCETKSIVAGGEGYGRYGRERR